MQIRKILTGAAAIGVLGVTLAGAQAVPVTTVNTNIHTGDKGQMMHKNHTDHKGGKEGKGDGVKHKDWKASKEKIENAIIAGDYNTFQTLSANTKFAKMDQATFNLLTPQYAAEKNAETQIDSILKTAGITNGHE